MLCREIIAVCSEIHTKHINTLCGQNVGLLNIKLAVRTLTTMLGGAPVTLPAGLLLSSLSYAACSLILCKYKCSVAESRAVFQLK
jgi:hypothetical protein